MNEAAKIAARLTLESLSSLQEKLDSGDLDASDLITPDVMRFIKEAQDRAHGTPKATSEVSGPDGGAIPTKLVVETQFVQPDD